MARNRSKVYKQGERINIYLSRDVTPEFVEWINKQSDLSNFFLYAAQQLYQQTGFVDVSEVMPRKINFELTSEDRTAKMLSSQEQTKSVIEEPANNPEPANVEQTIEEPGEETEEVKEEQPKKEEPNWGNIQDLDDPYA